MVLEVELSGSDIRFLFIYILCGLHDHQQICKTKVDLKVLGFLLGDGENEEAPKVVTKETIVEVKLIRERSIVGDKKPWESDDDSFRDF